jgi:hypothetical protein
MFNQQLRCGTIVVVRVLDSCGSNPKSRPVVITTKTEEIPDPTSTDEEIYGVAITSTLPSPLPTEYIPLPWHNNRHPRTGLNRPCAAYPLWQVSFFHTDIEKIIGSVPGECLLRIIAGLPDEFR